MTHTHSKSQDVERYKKALEKIQSILNKTNKSNRDKVAFDIGQVKFICKSMLEEKQ